MPKSDSTGRRSWKQRGATPSSSGGSSKSVGRWTLTLLLLALVIGFVILFWPDMRGRRYLVAVPNWATDQLTLPPIPYVREDLDALSQTGDVEYVDATGDAQHEAAFDALIDRVRQLAESDKDSLILYIAAHGLGGTDGPALACSDFDRAANRGRYPVKKLLATISQSKAAFKLVLLNVGWLNYDPRLGIVGNEFAAQVTAAVKAMPDSDVWVLLAAGPGQTSAVSHGERRSVFGRAVAEALAGEATRGADGKLGDQFIDLREFATYVETACRTWFGEDLPDAQTPLLLRAGHGVVMTDDIPNDDQHRLIFVTPRAPPADPKEPDKAARRFSQRSPGTLALIQAPVVPPEPLPKKEPTPKAVPVPVPKAAPPPAPAKASSPTPQQQLRAEVQQLWELRDKLVASATVVTPIDFAPHVWREVEARMLYQEQRLLSGRAVDSRAPNDVIDRQDTANRLRDVRGLSNNLTALSKAIAGNTIAAGDDEQSVGFRLVAAWNRYLAEEAGPIAKRDREATDEGRAARQAARQLRALIFDAVDLTRWFGHASATMSDASRLQKKLVEHLDGLAAAMTECRALIRETLRSDEVSRLKRFVDQVNAATVSAEQALGMLAEIEGTARTDKNERLARRRFEDLLATPLLPSATRMRLVDELGKISRTIATPANRLAAPPTLTDASQSRYRACLALEAKLVRLVDEEAARRIESKLESATAAQVIAEFHAGLTKALVNDEALLLVDPRDAVLVAGDQFRFPNLVFAVVRPAELRIEPVAKLLPLPQSGETRLSATLRATQPGLLALPVTPTDADGLFTFELLPESESLSTDGGWYGKTIHWRVTARPEAAALRKGQATIALSAKTANGEVTATVAVSLPQPDRVDASFKLIGTTDKVDGSADTFGLELYSNRTTTIQCSLLNQHQLPKSVHANLYAIAPRAAAKVPIGKFDDTIKRWAYDASAREFLKGNAKLVAKSAKPVDLSAANPDQPPREPTTFDFVSPNAVAPTPPAAGAPPVVVPAPPAEPIHGLVLEIVDTKDSRNVWLKWLEFLPRSPREYLNVEIGYDQRRQQVVARFSPKLDDDGRPMPLPAGPPIKIKWDPSEADLPAEGAKQLVGELDPVVDRPSVTLFATAPPDRERIIKIAVDEYPRAFLYRVPCRLDPTARAFLPGVDLAREHTNIVIESVTAANRAYHFLSNSELPPPPADEKAPKIAHQRWDPRLPALFAAPAETLLVRLQADAPIDAFTAANDRVQLKLRENDFTRTVTTCRDIRIALLSAGPRGILELETKVDDLTIPMQAGSLENIETVIDADIRFGTQEVLDHVRIQLDKDNPRIQEVSFGPLTANAKVKATLRAVDFSGIARVVFGFSKDGSKTLAEPISHEVTSRDDNGRHVVDFEIDLKDSPLGKRLFLVQVLDRVGHASEIFSREIVILPEPKAMPAKGEIRGLIKFGSASVNGSLFKITIEGGEGGTKTVAVDPNGRFVIPDLPIADYTLKISDGSFQGKTVPPKEIKGTKPTDPKLRKEQTFDVSG